MPSASPHYHDIHNGLVNLNKINQIYITAPNEGGYCQILGFEEFYNDLNPHAEMPPNILIGTYLEEDVGRIIEDIKNATI